MIDQVKSLTPTPPRADRGYVGVIITMAISLFLGGLSLHQGLGAHYQASSETALERVMSASSTSALSSEITSRLEVRVLTPKERGLPASLTTLIDTSDGHHLASVEDKPWFDAYWRNQNRWRGAKGSLWAASSASINTKDRSTSGQRQIARLAPRSPPPLPWLSLTLGGLFSLLFALLACAKVHQGWRLAALTPLSMTPLGLSLFWEISKAEVSTQQSLEGATLIPIIAMVPLLILGLSQSITEGRRSAHRVAYTYMAPTLISVGLLVFIPFSIGVALAFMRHSHGHFEWVGLSHFINILSASDYPLSHPLNFYFTLAVTLFWTFSNVLLHTSIGLSFALLLNREGLKLRGLYRALLIIPWAIPNYITALIWKGMFNQQYGLINQLLERLGIEPVSWMGSFWGAMTANITTNTWLGFPFMMVVTLGALQSIPTDLYEAANIAGASRWQTFRSITLPLLKPALLPAVILGSVWTFNMFNIIYLVSGGQPGGATDILITEAYRWAFEQDRYGYAAAYSLVIFFILLGYARLTQRLSKAAEEVYQ
jgi:ABC-type sugar transport system permease subunit